MSTIFKTKLRVHEKGHGNGLVEVFFS